MGHIHRRRDPSGVGLTPARAVSAVTTPTQDGPPSWTLAIETSGAPASIALADRSGEIFTAEIGGPRPDVARDLLPAIERLFRERSIAPRDIARVVLGVGPGSFTGLRVGATAARTLAAFARCPLAPFASTLALAAAAPEQARTIAVARDALRGELAVARYERRAGGIPVETVQPRLAPGASLPAIAAGCDVLVTDDPARLLRWPAPGCQVLVASPTAAALLALDRAGARPLERSVPLYLRASAAEERLRAAAAPTDGTAG